MGGQRGQEVLARGRGGHHVRGRQRDLRSEDAGSRGRDGAPAALHHLTRQPKHGGGLPAPADQRDDVVGREAERVRKLHACVTPSAARR